MLDILLWIVMEIMFGFLSYLTGVVLIRLFSLGRMQLPWLTYAAYRQVKKDQTVHLQKAQFIGLMFWILVLVITIAANWH